MTDERWPALPVEWRDTYATLHLWTQIVGKIALAAAPPLNHSWGVALQVGARGLSTRPLAHDRRTFTLGFDFVDHRLTIAATDGMMRTIPLAPRTVADFHAEVRSALDEMGLPVRIGPRPVEIPDPIRFDEDTVHASYDPGHANRCWRLLTQCHRVLSASLGAFVGKCSPVHFFWGSFDLAVTRFSGRPAPPRDGPAFMREAYSHEVISHGFWPGGGAGTLFGAGPVEEPVFYAYAVPPPPGFEGASVAPSAASYQRDLGEFILPYRAVRAAADPDRAILEFVQSTYARAADLAGWDRAALEKAPPGAAGAPMGTTGPGT